MKRALGIVSLLALLLTGPAVLAESREGPIGEMGLALGSVYPEGNFTHYAEDGLTGMLRANFHPRAFQAFSLVFDLGGTWFSSEKEDFVLRGDGLAVDGEKSTDQYALFLHAGLQLGSDSRNGFFRPRVSLAPGLYLFNTEVSWRLDGEDEDLEEDNNWQARFGWRALLGVDFFFSPRWAISIDIVYDHVLNIDHAVLVDESGQTYETSRSARFDGAMIGVVFPFRTAGGP